LRSVREGKSRVDDELGVFRWKMNASVHISVYVPVED
jgi:hypothetical protein